MKRTKPASAFTMVELLLALGLFAILVVALIRLLDTSLRIWGSAETNRDLLEMSTSVIELLAEDLQSAEGGSRGDLVGEWVRFDTDHDGTRSAPMMRLRLVRQASAADLLRLGSEGERERQNARALGLLEVCWALLPEPGAERDARSVGVLWRGARAVGDEDSASFFQPDFFDAAGKPAPGSLWEVTGGVLWFEAWYACQTSVLHDGWSLGDDLADCASSWDAWTRARPDPELHFYNQPASGAGSADELPVLPRRMLVTLELERASERKFRTRLARTVDPESKSIAVADAERLPPAGSFVLVDEEWMQILSAGGGEASVKRGERGTLPTAHQPGALVHHGARCVREIPLPMLREDWNL